jgi:hypothetical protein
LFVDATAPGQPPTLQDAVQEAAEKGGKVLPLSAKPAALVFGPENGAIGERLVQEAAKEASLKNYTQRTGGIIKSGCWASMHLIPSQWRRSTGMGTTFRLGFSTPITTASVSMSRKPSSRARAHGTA